MRKFIIIMSVIFFCTSCFVHKGQWNGEQCRPKKPNFRILKTPFKETHKLVFNRVYTLNGDNKEAIGFYKDGRFIMIFNYDKNIQNYVTLSQNFIKNNNWKNSRFIGYWRVEKDKIKIEYFVCGDFGTYIEKHGVIKGDTIFFERDCGTSNPFKTIKCPEKYVLSDMSFE